MLVKLIIVCCAQITTGSILEELLTEKVQPPVDLKHCFANLTKQLFNNNEYVLYSHWNTNISNLFGDDTNYQTQVFNSKEQRKHIIFYTFYKYTAYLLVVKKTNFAESLDVLRSMSRWNARAKFIIILDDTVTTEIWKKLISYYVVNVIIVQVNDLQLFTYFPYKYENLRNPDLESVNLGFCKDYDTDLGNFSIPRIPKQWKNTTIIIAYMPLHPYILDVDESTGIEIEIVGLMSGFMKYNVSYSTVKYVDWGVYYPQNHSYTGPVSAVQRYEADFVIGHFHLREEERLDDFDVSFTYMDDDICWIVPIALIRSHWQNIMNIFNYPTWCATIISMFLSYLSWQFFNWVSPYITPEAYRYYKNPLCSMEVPFLNFLGLPIMHEPKSWATRFLFLVIFVFCFVLVTGWKSYLIVSLTHDTPEYQIQTLKDLTTSGLTIGIYYELVDLHCADGTPEGDYVCQNADRSLCDASHDCLDRCAYQRDMATIATKRILNYMSPQAYRTPTGREMVYLFKTCIGKDYTVQYYTPGHPLFERSSELLMWIRTGGFVDNLDHKLVHKIELSFQEYMKGKSKFEISVLGLLQLQGMFYLLLGGLLVSTVAFIGELFVYKYRHKIRVCYARFWDYFSAFGRLLCARID